ncbi:SDR family oxidoreductase [Actinokineospora globicatena]|uniref:SDR family oxidoreductase n=1 Tax=Actinokineospora globicatena TaxID=103729 RepID=UPI0020A35FCB|nr:NAD(P)H-binding protein [Actinokineospora globicatena]MCP2304514.1 Uncharacterized conserved protein YbjT, contains NAD(P)-binding and DUF2867 domains [Actinokineospora globicatena]GLW78118.1 nucleotide-diphosphate-sugar epimerase [Actinokineospora globicatena]GLW85216.1 nucleotide-diphosphate-sugar epimerase [Actinokineospora globicatena]
MRVLVTGATGNVGRHVVDELLAAGVAVRAMTRRPETARFAEDVEVVGGDLDAPETLEGAFEGVDGLYLFAAGKTASVLEQAKRAGVTRVVLLSSASVGFGDEQVGESHRVAEEAVEDSGLEWTHLRPGMFATNLLEWAASIREEGVVREPYGLSAQTAIHEVDIAEVAVAALTTDRHVGQVLALTGPQVQTKVEQARTIGAAIGREIRFEELTPEQWKAELPEEVPGWVADWLLAVWAGATEIPETALSTVEDVLGKPARTLAQWAADHADDFR